MCCRCVRLFLTIHGGALLRSTLRLSAVAVHRDIVDVRAGETGRRRRRYARDAGQRIASGDRSRSARAGCHRRAKLSGRWQRNPGRLPGNGACPGTHGVSRMFGVVGRPDFRDLCPTGRLRQRRHAAEHHSVLLHRSRRGSRHRFASRRGLYAGHSGFADRMGPGETRHRTGSGPRSVESNVQVHDASE